MPEAWSPKPDSPSPKDRNMMYIPGNPELRRDPKIRRTISFEKERRVEGETALETQKKLGMKTAREMGGRLIDQKFETLHTIGNGIVLSLEAINPHKLHEDDSDETTAKTIAKRLALLRSYYRGMFTTIENGKEIFHQAEYDERMTAAVAEFAAMEALYESFGRRKGEIYHPSQTEDLRYGIDAWLRVPGDRVAAIQVKCLHASKAASKLVVGLGNDPAQIENRITENPDFQGYDAFRTTAKKREFNERGRAMLTYCSRYDNVTPAYVILPTTDRGPVTFDPVTGLPTDQMVDELERDLEFLL